MKSLLSDEAAAVECLRYLQHTKAWPSQKKTFKKCLREAEGAAQQNLPKLAVWLSHNWKESVSDRRKEVFRRLVEIFERHGCLKRGQGSKSWTWNQSNVNLLMQTCENGAPSLATSSNKPAATTPNIPTKDNTMNTKSHAVEESFSFPIILIDNNQKLLDLKRSLHFSSVQKSGFVTRDERSFISVACETLQECLCLIQLGLHNCTYIFDCVSLGPIDVYQFIKEIVENKNIVKLFHDVHQTASVLSRLGAITFSGILDTQLVMEFVTGNPFVGLNETLNRLEVPGNPLASLMKRFMKDKDLLLKRPLQPVTMEVASLKVSSIFIAKDKLLSFAGNKMEALQRASEARALAAVRNGGCREMAFDMSNSYRVASLELLKEIYPDTILEPKPLVVSDDASMILDLLPSDLSKRIASCTRDLFEIALDVGRQPIAWVGEKRVFLGSDDRKVEPSDISAIVEKLGGFGPDNRAGIEQQLHRISAIRNRQSDIIGLTMRVGRHVTGNATMIADLLLGDNCSSILFLGEPGSGKTTIIREVTRLIADHTNACIVDTSNEIAGDGNVPHPCVGLARRMMVRSLNDQANVMIECIQNHTPSVMIIDEIGRSAEVEAARTCKERGVRLIASAHGDFRKLIKNPKLRGLVGGAESVTLGDAQAKIESKGGTLNKLKTQRAGAPVFDIIVELRRGAHHEWIIILDSADAVDKVLEGYKYTIQKRIRDPESGAIQFHDEQG